jgi:hypothetical protein
MSEHLDWAKGAYPEMQLEIANTAAAIAQAEALESIAASLIKLERLVDCVKQSKLTGMSYFHTLGPGVVQNEHP